MTIRISMWSGPRNISTTMMRAFGNRPDTAVVDEPFYACYLKASGAEHPLREATLAAMSADWGEVRAQMLAPPPAGKAIVFAKHIAYHYPDDEPLDWLRDHRSFILIREPALMVASFARKSAAIEPIIESYRVCRRVHDFCAANALSCPVVDSGEILADPGRMLERLCDALDIPYSDCMLSWAAGPRQTDGPWAPHWYDAVNASTGFAKSAGKRMELSAELNRLCALAEPDYRFFRDRRLLPDAV